MEVGKETWTLRRSAPVQSTPGAPGPEATGRDPEAERRFKLSHSIDGSQFAQAPAATSTEEERTFADEVPSVCRVHIRQEILSADHEDDAAETVGRGILWREKTSLGHYLAHANDPPPEGDSADQDDSYQVISSNSVRGPEKQFRVHLLTVEGFCLGCGWRPRSTQMTVLTPGEYWANPTGYGKCARCFAKGDLPKSWFVSRLGTVEGKDIPDLEVDTESSATSGSETDDSVDTQSVLPAPEALQPHLDFLTKPLALILVAKQIPWVVQAKLAQEGYVTVEDLGDRWNTPEDARAQGPRDLEFTAMRLLQAVRAAKSLAQTQLHVGRTTATEPPGTAKGPLDSLCDRRVLETAYAEAYSCLKPRLESQGSDAYLKRQFKRIAAGELGYIQAKHIVGALPEDGERPVKTTRKVSVDGWDRADEEETRPDPRNRRQLERTHTVFRTTLLMCIAGQPQFAHLRLSKETPDEWYEWFYGEDIAGRRPPPSERVLQFAERNAWRKIHDLVHSGTPLTEALSKLRHDHLFWQREGLGKTRGKPWTQVWQTQWDKPAKGGKDRGRKTSPEGGKRQNPEGRARGPAPPASSEVPQVDPHSEARNGPGALGPVPPTPPPSEPKPRPAAGGPSRPQRDHQTKATSMPTGERVPLPPEAKPTILLLYAGKDDAGSLDSYLHATCPDLSSLVWAIDIRRDKGPVRGRSETDDDSMLVLLQMYLTSLAYQGLAQCHPPRGPHGGQRQPPGTQVLIPVGDPSLHQVGKPVAPPPH
ncbi:unnamed protein product [Durusdinium trenchii]|uniref:Uncharacterized protein n=1 Tax=Durusdinium trenchii TaxID=1381693 RepID=A0ABP0NJ46_9DINO